MKQNLFLLHSDVLLLSLFIQLRPGTISLFLRVLCEF